MDGNGRWAEARGRDRSTGHLKGAKVARKIIDECTRLGVEYLTLYAFSSENWFRPIEEVTFLMHLLQRHLIRERRTLMDNNIRFNCIGEIDRLPKAVQKEVMHTIQATSNNTGMRLTFALSYGSRQEITHAVQAIARRVQDGSLKVDEIDPQLVAGFLETSYMPDPDLIIRTSGESRLSNFLMWQAAYSEILITEIYWPDFSVSDLHDAFTIFQSRERRFGRTSSQLAPPSSEKEPRPRSSAEAST
jgi:undecaprenyl diphosphate synthase